jgi:D-3-phosphoglycerate dehydrogenase
MEGGLLMKVFITQNIEQESIELLESKGIEVQTSGVDRPLSRSEFLDGIKDADAIIFVWHTEQMDKEAFEIAKNLKIIARRGVGYDNIDLEEAKKRNIFVTVTPVHTHTIADLTFGLLINAARKIHLADAFVRNGEWTEGGVWVARKFMGYDIHHKKIGIIGLGKIGKNMAKRAKGFDMEVAYFDVNRQPEAEEELGITYSSLDELLAESDFISINCALTESTRNLINGEAINKMKNTAILVVSARGGIVDESALYKALTEGKLGGAGLDVFDPEPIQADNPLLKLDNVVFTPHLGASVQETRVLMAVTAAEEVLRVLKNEQPKFPLFNFNSEVKF